MLTADTGADEPKLYVSRKSITETKEWGREKNKSPVIKRSFKLLCTHKPRTWCVVFFSPALKNIAFDLDDRTGSYFLIGVHVVQ